MKFSQVFKTLIVCGISVFATHSFAVTPIGTDVGVISIIGTYDADATKKMPVFFSVNKDQNQKIDSSLTGKEYCYVFGFGQADVASSRVKYDLGEATCFVQEQGLSKQVNFPLKAVITDMDNKVGLAGKVTGRAGAQVIDVGAGTVAKMVVVGY